MSSLRTRLDRDIYQLISRLENDSQATFSSLAVYEYIKSSNSSLARQKRKPLEDSIARALAARKKEKVQSGEEDSDSALERRLEEEEKRQSQTKPQESSSFLLNRQIARSWNMAPAAPSRSSKKQGETNGSDSGLARMESSASVRTTIERQSNGEAKPKRKKTEASTTQGQTPPTDISLNDFGGIDHIVDKLAKFIGRPYYMASYLPTPIYGHIARGILLHGPPGCGKTSLVGAYAASLEVSYIPVSAPSVVAGTSGESEKKIRDLFEEAKRLAPSILFFDEIDVIMGKREMAQREMEKRMVAQMATALDEISSLPAEKLVLVFAATNRPDHIDDSLRRGGRFEVELAMGMPDEKARCAILEKFCKDITVSPSLDFKRLAKLTPGFVGADLKALVGIAQHEQSRRIWELLMKDATEGLPDDSDLDTARELEIFKEHYKRVKEGGMEIERTACVNYSTEGVTFEDFQHAICEVQPMAKREGFSSIPDTTWDEIGGMSDIRQQLFDAIVGPIEDPVMYSMVGRTSPSGVLLWGPPGCGKTLVAKAVANEANANFIAIKGPELLNKYVGESEKSVRQLFARARQSQPCILFFDELDSLVPNRDDTANDSSHRVVNAMLTELDGVDNRTGVYIIAATNRPDRIDHAILRPGRLGTLAFVDLPSVEGRVEILEKLVKSRLKERATPEVLAPLGDICRSDDADGLSGADLEALLTLAGNNCLKRAAITREFVLVKEDWELALKNVRRSVTNPDMFRVKMKKALERLMRR